jgi:cell division septum initiation protein DivIVA
MELNEQVAYLRGLIEGQEFGEEKDMILWEQVLNLFDLVSAEISNLKDQDDDLEEYVEAIDEDLGYLEERYCPAGDAEEEVEYESAELNS